MTFWKGDIDWRMTMYSSMGYSFLQLINHHHLGKKGFLKRKKKTGDKK